MNRQKLLNFMIGMIVFVLLLLGCRLPITIPMFKPQTATTPNPSPTVVTPELSAPTSPLVMVATSIDHTAVATPEPSAPTRDYSNLVFGEVVESNTWTLSIEGMSSTRPNDLYLLYGINYAIKNISPNSQYYRLNSLPIELLDGDGYALDTSGFVPVASVPFYIPSGLVVRHVESLRVNSRSDPKEPLQIVTDFAGSRMIFNNVQGQAVSLVSDEQRVGRREPVPFGSVKLELLDGTELGFHNEGSQEVNIEWPGYPWVNFEPKQVWLPNTKVMIGLFLDEQGALCASTAGSGFATIRIPANAKVRVLISTNCPQEFGQVTRLLIFDRNGNTVVFDLGFGSSTSVSPTVTPSASYDDLYGRWRKEDIFLSFGHNRFTGEDARFKFTDAAGINDLGAYELKTTTDWTEIVFTSDADSGSCAGQIGRYTVIRTDEGELLFDKIEDQCPDRAKFIPGVPFVRDTQEKSIVDYNDLYGGWRQGDIFLGFEHNRFTGEDARFKFTDAAGINDLGAYELKETDDWTEIVFTSDADSGSCAGQIGRYRILLSGEGELLFDKIEDQCPDRANHIPGGPFVQAPTNR